MNGSSYQNNEPFGPVSSNPYGALDDPNAQWGAATYGGSAAKVGTDANGNTTYTPSSAQQFANTYDLKAVDQTNRAAPTLNYGPANTNLNFADQSVGQAGKIMELGNYARAGEASAAELQRDAALGKAPSAAENLANNVLSTGMQQQLGAAASAPGGAMGRASAIRNVQQGAAAQLSQGANNIGALRANEMANARSAYGQQSNALRGGDLASGQAELQRAGMYGSLAGTQAGMANTQAGLEMGQRQLNQGNEQFYAGMGNDVRTGEANRGVQRTQIGAEQNMASGQIAQHSQDRSTGVIGQIVGGIGGFLGGLSDERTKQPVNIDVDIPVRHHDVSLSENPFAEGYASGQKTMGSKKKEEAKPIDKKSPYSDKIDTSPLRLPGKEPEYLGEADDWDPGGHSAELMGGTDNPYEPMYGVEPGTEGGINRQDPYGSGEVFFSDSATKERAFNEGVKHAVGSGLTNAIAPHVGMANAAARAGAAGMESVSGMSPDQKYEAAHAVAQLPGMGPISPLAMTNRWTDSYKELYDKAVAERENEARFKAEHAREPRSAELTGERPRAREISYGGADEKPAASYSGPGAPLRGEEPRSDYHGLGAPLYSSSEETKTGKPTDRDPDAMVTRGKGAGSQGNLEALERDANLRMAGFPWAYKPEFTPPGEEQGQPHYGTTTQELEKNPISKLAVRHDPKTGLGAVHAPSMLQVQGAGIASLQRQVDALTKGKVRIP